MTTKEKAQELFNKYYSYLKANLMYDEEAREDSKVCALIAVDEILFSNNTIFETNIPHECWKYWQEVKQEIELL